MRRPGIKRIVLMLALLAAITWVGNAAVDARVHKKAMRFARVFEAARASNVPVSLVEQILFGLLSMDSGGCDRPQAVPVTRPT